MYVQLCRNKRNKNLFSFVAVSLILFLFTLMFPSVSFVGAANTQLC